MLITIEGVNGVGKDYVIDRVKEHFKDRLNYTSSKPIFKQQEAIDGIVNLENLTFMQRFELGNLFIDNMKEISKTIEDDKIYLSNRWSLSTVVYNVTGLTDISNSSPNYDKGLLEDARLFRVDGITVPDYVIYLTADTNTIIDRIEKRGKYVTWYEKTRNRIDTIKATYEYYIHKMKHIPTLFKENTKVYTVSTDIEHAPEKVIDIIDIIINSENKDT